MPLNERVTMLIHAYLVESHRHGAPDFKPEPVPVGTVQFTGGSEQVREEEAATELLSHFSRLANDPVLGLETWYAELISVDDDSLGSPAYDNASEGYRIWLPS
jgi:hypothetical protein